MSDAPGTRIENIRARWADIRDQSIGEAQRDIDVLLAAIKERDERLAACEAAMFRCGAKLARLAADIEAEAEISSRAGQPHRLRVRANMLRDLAIELRPDNALAATARATRKKGNQE